MVTVKPVDGSCMVGMGSLCGEASIGEGLHACDVDWAFVIEIREGDDPVG